MGRGLPKQSSSSWTWTPLKRIWEKLTKGSKSVCNDWDKVKWLLPSSSVAGAWLSPSHAHLVYAPKKTLMLLLWGRLFLFRGSVSRELSVWTRWAQTPQGYFKAWSQSIFPIQLGRFHVSNGPSPVCSNSSPRIYRPRTTDLCYVI